MAFSVRVDGVPTFSVAEVGFYEGAEKLLEFWFHLPDGSSPVGIRAISQASWKKLLKLVKCEVLSIIQNDTTDAYLLSESSLFVFPNRVILKTCGTTTLLVAIKPIMALVEEAVPGAVAINAFYSHLHFKAPHLQAQPHTSFEEEVSLLDQLLTAGSPFAFGQQDGANKWYMYAMQKPDYPLCRPDQTLEVIMTDLDTEVSGHFSPRVFSSPEHLVKAMGFQDIMKGAIIDAKLFTPCGFSLNALFEDEVYFTIHVTPQVECSFASFETNLPKESYSTLISDVVAIFKPGKCTVTVYSSKNAKYKHEQSSLSEDYLPGYHCIERHLCPLPMYSLYFSSYKQEIDCLE